MLSVPPAAAGATLCWMLRLYLVVCLCGVLQEALNRQSRPTAEELGLSMDPFTDSMSDLDTLGLRLEYVAAMMQGVSRDINQVIRGSHNVHCVLCHTALTFRPTACIE
jgi:LSD1 subclass zinc finger protein